MKVRLSVSRSIWETLRRLLFADAPKEGAVVLLCEEGRTPRARRLIGRLLVVPGEEDLAVQGSCEIGFTKGFLKKILNLCKSRKLHLVATHSHPFCTTNVGFSAIDDQWDSELCAYTGRVLPRMIHASLVVGAKSCDARFYDGRTESFSPLQSIDVMGEGFERIYPTSLADWSETAEVERYDRQRIIFGVEGQRQIQDLTAAEVGLGGIGSHVAQQIALLGVRKQILTDPDRVERTNLSRLIGAVPRDADRRELKVVVAERAIRRMSPHTRVVAAPRSVTESGGLLKQADVIFVCVDAEAPKAFCTRFPAQYNIPMVDAAVGIAVGDGKVSEIYGQVRLILPEGPCLFCMGGVDRELLRQETLTLEERERERRHGYVVGADVPAPAVVSLNGALASLAVTEFLNLVGRFRRLAQCIFYDGMSVDRIAFGIAAEKRNDCPVCGWNSVGRGDSKPLPDFSPVLGQLPRRKERNDGTRQ